MRTLCALACVLAACHSDSGNLDMSDQDLSGSEVDLAGATDDAGGIFDNDGGLLEPDGGVPPGDGGVNKVSCGNMPCDTASGNVCCYSFQMGMPSATCEAAAMCTMGQSRACDGPEDCMAGMSHCCGGLLGSTSCQATCSMTTTDICHTKSDCPAAPANRTAACCPVSQTLRACRNFFGDPPSFFMCN